MVFTLLVLAMIPRDKPAFDPDAFMNPPAAASTAEAETHAHNLSVFAEGVMQRLAEQPERLPEYPQSIRVDALDQGRGLDPVLPAAYRATMPWEALLLPVPEADDEGEEAGLNGIGAVIAFVNPVNLPRRMRSVDIARGLKLTAGDEVPVGLVRNGMLLSEDLVSPTVAKGFGQVRNLPQIPELQNAPAIVVCLDPHFCGAPDA